MPSKRSWWNAGSFQNRIGDGWLIRDELRPPGPCQGKFTYVTDLDDRRHCPHFGVKEYLKRDTTIRTEQERFEFVILSTHAKDPVARTDHMVCAAALATSWTWLSRYRHMSSPCSVLPLRCVRMHVSPAGSQPHCCCEESASSLRREPRLSVESANSPKHSTLATARASI